MTFEILSATALRRAADLKDQIETLYRELSHLLNGASAIVEKTPAGKRTMSAGARARIAAAQKARWAARRKGAIEAPQKSGARGKFTRARRELLAAAAKARWAKAKAAGKSSL